MLPYSMNLSELRNDSNLFSAIEASIGIESKSENPEAPMAIALITDEIIMNSNLKPVTSAIAFNSGRIPNENGLFSTNIFGRDTESREKQFAYIDLYESFFHPYVYEILKSLMPKRFDKCAFGQNTSWKITDNGELVEIKKDDPEFNEDSSGISWLIKNYHKLKFTESGSMVRSDRIKLLKSLSDEEIFITKWIVIPVIYRDVEGSSSGAYKMPKINNHYNKIIQYSNSLRTATFDFFNNQVRYNLQQELVTIRKYGQSLLEKKNGFFQKSILGKSIDRGSRDVISVAVMDNLQRPSDNPIDIFHSGIPLAKCLILGYDFVLRYCLQFFADNFRNVTEYPIYKLQQGEYKIVGSVKIKNQIERFSSDYIKKKINRFKNSHGTRFEFITIETEDGKEIPIHLSGQLAPMSDKKITSSTILNRPMTWTDLFYLAAENTLSDKYVYITRYPITSHSSIFPSQCRVLSTIRTIPAYIDGQFYKYYPYIDLNTPSDRISNVFNDTVTMSNMYLSAIGGDFDGDQTGQKLCFSLEANAEAKEITESVRNFVSPDGRLLRVLGNEAYLTFYNMTRDKPVGGVLSNELKAELLKLKKNDLTVNRIAELFGNTTSISDGKKNAFKVKHPKFNPQAKFVLQPGEYINKETVTTSVGIFLFNKLMVEGMLEEVVPNGYYNEICNKKAFSKLCDIVAEGIMSQKLPIKPTVADWTNAYEFWGLSLVSIFASSYSMGMIVPNKELERKKDELLNNAPDNDLATLSKIEQQLLQEADKLTDGEPGKFLFDSGARGSFSNDFKNMAISIGPVENPVDGTFEFMKSSYMSGIKKEDIPKAANTIVNAEYPKAVGTAQGGYMSKIFYAVFQTMSIDEDGTDCGTKNGLPVVLTKDNLNDYIDQYIMDGNKLILIDKDLPAQYMNHTVYVRSPMYCIGDKICSKCAGRRFYKVGITDIGLTVPAMSGALQNAQLKKRHQMAVKMHNIDENSILK